jgi:hypothetical protein
VAAALPAPSHGKPARGVPSQADPARPVPSAGQEIEIPEGPLRLGSETGSAGRNPAREADNVAVRLHAFAIDALPYPNDPRLAPRSALSRDEAAARCAESGKRLCSELEWERACKGDDGAEYPVPGAFDPVACGREPLSCRSAAGVFGMGTLGREWTGSNAEPADWDGQRGALVRGAAPSALRALHRCAARDVASPESRSDSLFFRCCRGAPQAQVYPSQPAFPAFRELDSDVKSSTQVLEAMPETRALATGFRPFSQQSVDQALASARAQPGMASWHVARTALIWSPRRGEEIVVLSGDTPQGALLVAYYPLPAGAARFAGSYHTRGDHAPILVAHKSDAREELLFSTCWGCAGEGGTIRLDGEARVRLSLR